MTDSFNNEQQMDQDYGSLKTLTVFTFVGCALGYIGGFWSFFKADKGVADMETAMSRTDLPDMAKKFLTPEALERAKLAAENKLPILVIGLVATTLCLVGAIQMRKLKAQGYYLWLIGEILPFIGTAMFINVATIYSGFSLIGVAIVLLFIILYTVQRKYLVNK
ncbi:MAG: hypothetical protein KGO81_02595 [Bacteroidota bacterium]|nr:hypothetical protein [Bacteroidota bacterium]